MVFVDPSYCAPSNYHILTFCLGMAISRNASFLAALMTNSTALYCSSSFDKYYYYSYVVWLLYCIVIKLFLSSRGLKFQFFYFYFSLFITASTSQSRGNFKNLPRVCFRGQKEWYVSTKTERLSIWSRKYFFSSSFVISSFLFCLYTVTIWGQQHRRSRAERQRRIGDVRARRAILIRARDRRGAEPRGVKAGNPSTARRPAAVPPSLLSLGFNLRAIPIRGLPISMSQPEVTCLLSTTTTTTLTIELKWL